MKIVWMPEAWEDYLYWQTKDKKVTIQCRFQKLNISEKNVGNFS